MNKTLAVLAALALASLPGMASASGKGGGRPGGGGRGGFGGGNKAVILNTRTLPAVQFQNFNKLTINNGKFQNTFVPNNFQKVHLNNAFRVQWNAGQFFGRVGHRWWDARRGCYLYYFPGQRNYCCYSTQQGCFVPLSMPIPTQQPETVPAEEPLPLPPDETGTPPDAPADPAVPPMPMIP